MTVALPVKREALESSVAVIKPGTYDFVVRRMTNQPETYNRKQSVTVLLRVNDEKFINDSLYFTDAAWPFTARFIAACGVDPDTLGAEWDEQSLVGATGKVIIGINRTDGTNRITGYVIPNGEAEAEAEAEAGGPKAYIPIEQRAKGLADLNI